MDEAEFEHIADMGAISDGNPFLLDGDMPVGNVFASEGGAEAEVPDEQTTRKDEKDRMDDIVLPKRHA
eukprot:2744827-Amphidinium_carterae.1